MANASSKKSNKKKKKKTAKIAALRPVGRPTDYRPEFCERVLELGREGKSRAQMAAALNVSRQTIEDWCKAHPKFLDAITMAKDLSQAWWEDIAQKNIVMAPNTGTFQAAVWNKSMTARFSEDYRDKSSHEVSGPNGGPVDNNFTLSFVRPGN